VEGELGMGVCAFGLFAAVVVLLLLLLLRGAYLAWARYLLAFGRDRRGSLIVRHCIRKLLGRGTTMREISREGLRLLLCLSRNAGGDTTGRHRRVIDNTLFVFDGIGECDE